GPDVARDQCGRHADLYLRRIARGDLPLLRGAPARRRAVPDRHAADGLERLADRARAQARHGGRGGADLNEPGRTRLGVVIPPFLWSRLTPCPTKSLRRDSACSAC